MGYSPGMNTTQIDSRDVAPFGATGFWAVYSNTTLRVIGVWTTYADAAADAARPRPSDFTTEGGAS